MAVRFWGLSMDDRQCPIVMLSGEKVSCLGQRCGWYMPESIDGHCMILETSRLCLQNHGIIMGMKMNLEALQGEIREQVRALKKFTGRIK